MWYPQRYGRHVIVKNSWKRLSRLSLRSSHLHSLHMYVYRFCKFDRGTMPCFFTPLSNPDNKVSLNLAYHRTNIRRLRPAVLSRYLRRCFFVVDPITGRCERVLRNKRAVRLLCRASLHCMRHCIRNHFLKPINKKTFPVNFFSFLHFCTRFVAPLLSSVFYSTMYINF